MNLINYTFIKTKIKLHRLVTQKFVTLTFLAHQSINTILKFTDGLDIPQKKLKQA